MKLTRLLLPCAVLLFVSPLKMYSRTQDVAVAGTLSTLVASDRATLTDLTLTGTIDQRDLSTLNGLPVLQHLDMSGVTISAYNTYEANSIPASAFQSNTHILTLSLPTTLVKINDYAFCGMALTSVIVPPSVTTMGKGVFKACWYLTSVDFSPSVTTLSDQTFQNCGILPTIVLPDAITSIGADAFNYCQKLVSVKLPASLKTIGASSFYQCIALKTIELPVGVTSITGSSFTYCTALTKVTLNNPTPVYVTTNVFPSAIYSTCELVVPKGSLTAYASQSPWSSFTHRSEQVTPPTNVDTAGNLGNILTPTAKSTTKELILTGSVNSADFQVMNGMPLLETLNLKDVTIADNIIPANALANNKVLTTVVLPTTITELGEGALQGCTKLKDLTIPASLATIGASVFSGCTSLTTVSIPNPNATIGARAFSGCTSLASVTLPTSLTAINDNLFSTCTSISQITLPTTVGSIGSSAFSDAGLTQITIPASVATIGANAFSNCTKLTTVVALNPQPVPLADAAFTGVKKATCKLSVPQGSAVNYKTATDWSGFAYIMDPTTAILNLSTSGGLSTVVSGTQLTSMTLSGSLDQRDLSALNSMSTLSTLNMKDANLLAYSTYPANQIPTSAFANKKSLVSVELPNTLTDIGVNAFNGCTNLASVTLPNSLASIGGNAFYACSKLTEITIPSTVTGMGMSAFGNCTSLSILRTMNATPITINDLIFTGVNKNMLRLSVPQGSLDTYKNATTWNTFASISDSKSAIVNASAGSLLPSLIIDADVPTLSSLVLTGKFDKNDFVKMCSLPALTSVKMKGASIVAVDNNGENVVPNAAFQNNTVLTNIELPSSIIAIGSDAFSGCTELTSVNIPSTVSFIAAGAFNMCNKLTDITLPTSVVAIGENAFANCALVKAFDFPTSLSAVGGSAFSGCSSLSKLVLPSTLNAIGENAFANCTGLTSIKLLSSNPVSINETVFANVDLKKVKLSVPTGSALNYKGTDGWKSFASISDTKLGIIDSPLGGQLSSLLLDEDKVTVSSLQLAGYYDEKDIAAMNQMSALAAINMKNATIIDSSSSLKGSTKSAKGTQKMIKGNAGTLDNVLPASAFANNTSLKSIDLPTSLVAISDDAFNGCTALNNLIVPNSVLTIGKTALSRCTSLTDVTLPSSLMAISDNLFNASTAIKQLDIPASVTSIGMNAFLGCSGLTTITLPSAVTSINENAFAYCANLSSLKLLNPEPVVVNANVFEGVDKQSCKLTVPQGKAMVFKASDVWKTFSTIIDPQNAVLTVTQPGQLANTISDTDKPILTTLSVSGPVDQRDFATMNSMPLLSSVNLSDVSVAAYDNYPANTIPANAFTGKAILSTIELPTSITSIADNAFNSCAALTTLTLPESITSLGSQAFAGCTNLTTINLPNTLNVIGTSTFSNCPKLTNVTLPNALTSIADEAFLNCSAIDQITLPATLTNIGNSVFAYTGLSGLIVPESVQNIGEAVFSHCTNLSSVQLPSTLQVINKYLFFECSALTKIELPKTVSAINASAFYNCTALNEIKVLNPNPVSVVDNDNLDNVFIGVDKSNCSLIVPALGYNNYKEALVWKDFSKMTMTEAPVGITTVAANKANVRTVSGNVYVQSQMQISNATLYSLNGKVLSTTLNPTNTFSLPMGSEKVVILKLSYKDGTAEQLKIVSME